MAIYKDPQAFHIFHKWGSLYNHFNIIIKTLLSVSLILFRRSDWPAVGIRHNPQFYSIEEGNLLANFASYCLIWAYSFPLQMMVYLSVTWGGLILPWERWLLWPDTPVRVWLGKDTLQFKCQTKFAYTLLTTSSPLLLLDYQIPDGSSIVSPLAMKFFLNPFFMHLENDLCWRF